MRRVVPLLALVTVVVGACHRVPEEMVRPDAAPPAHASASVATASANPGDAGASPTQAFCTSAYLADEARLREKCSLADMAKTQSMERAAASLCGKDFNGALARSRATFDPDAAGRCVDMLQQTDPALTSESDTLFAHFPCDRVLLGLQGDGQPCRFSVECKEGLACVGYKPGVDGACKKPPLAHEACTLQPFGTIINEAAAAPHHPACAAGAYCDGTTCQPRVPAGKACTKADVCVSGLSCVAGKCGARAAAGAACGSTGDCVYGLFCDVASDGGRGVCAARHSDGQACTRAEECRGRCDFPNVPNGHAAASGTCSPVCGSG